MDTFLYLIPVFLVLLIVGLINRKLHKTKGLKTEYVPPKRSMYTDPHYSYLSENIYNPHHEGLQNKTDKYFS